MKRFCLIMFCLAGSIPAGAQSPPKLTSVVPDRAAEGTEISLFGEDLGDAEDSVEVLFDEDISVSANPGGSFLTVTVPSGAQTGDIRVGVSHPGQLEQVSNSLPFQVVWEYLDLEPIFSQYDFIGWYFNCLSQGWENGPDIVLSFFEKIYPYFDNERVWGLGQDGSATPLGYFPAMAWKPRRNPITGHWFALIGAGSGSGSTLDLVNLNTGETLFSTPDSSYSWTPRGFDFDSLGNLVISADILVPDVGWRLGLWRFAPGEQVVLDPSFPSALIPGVASNSWGWQGEIAIADDDTIYCVDADNDPNPAGIWRVPGFDGSSYQRIQMPASSVLWAGYGYWFLATDCMGEGYAINPCLLDEGCWSNFVLYRLSDLAPVATMTDTQDFLALTNDRFANFYFETLKSDGTTWHDAVKRVRPEELPPGFYGYSLRSSAPDRLPEASSTPPYQPPPLLEECRSNNPPAACSTPGMKRILQNLEIADTCRKSGNCRVDSQRMEALRSQSKRPTSKGVMCPLPGNEGHLALQLRRQDGSETIYEETPAEVELALGEEIEFSALWIYPDGPPAPIAVKWSPADAAPDWRSAHPAEVGSTHKVLFPDDVLLLFDENHPDAEVQSREAQVVHTGTVTLNMTLNPLVAPDGEEHHFQADVAGAYASRLGTTHNNFDALINQFANAYGILPQVLKGLIDRESAGWDTLAYRFEPKGWDWGMIKDHLSRTYYKDFRFEEPTTSGVGGYSRGAWLGADEINARVNTHEPLVAGSWLADLSAWICAGVDDIYFGLPIPAWDLIVGSNGVQGLPYHGGGNRPCGARHNWFVTKHSLKQWEEDGSPPSPCTTKDCRAARWFFNHRDYNAQTFLAASYGLTQIGYPTVFAGLKWRESDPSHRTWADIVAPENNIYFGARWLVQQPGFRKFTYWKNQYQLRAHHDRVPLEKLYKTLACTYNGRYEEIAGKKYATSHCSYAADILHQSTNFLPVP